MKVAIIDNDASIIEKMRMLVYEEFNDCIVDTYIDNFENIYQSEYEIAIFDICLGKKSGIDLATKYSMFYSKCLIIFISNYEEFVFDVFSINTFIFIRKHYLEKEFKRFALKYHKLMNDASIVVKYNSDLYTILVNDILFIEVFHNTSHIHMNDIVHTCNMSLKRLELEINKDYFIRINRYILLNLKHVKEIKCNKICLVNEEEFYIPKGKIQSFKMSYIQYLAKSRY